MADRHQILNDQEFWARLEYAACRWLESAADLNMRRYWIDGFVPDGATTTQKGLNVEGVVWIGERENSHQHGCRFVASVPQRLLDRRRVTFAIESLSLDLGRECLDVVIACQNQIA